MPDAFGPTLIESARRLEDRSRLSASAPCTVRDMSQRIVAAVLEALLCPAIRWGSAGPLLLISLAIKGSPGPATISLIAAGSVYGVRRSLPYLAGIIVGTTIVLVAVATGITAALLAVRAIGSILIGISAVYIVWLADQMSPAPPLSE